MQSSQQSINPWILKYITRHQETQTRYQIDKHLIEAGHKATEIEFVWQTISKYGIDKHLIETGYKATEIEFVWHIINKAGVNLASANCRWKFSRPARRLGQLILTGAIILCLFSCVFYPGIAYVSLFGKLQGTVASLVALLPSAGVVTGATLGYVWQLTRFKRYGLVVVTGLILTLVSALIVGRPYGTNEAEAIIYIPVIFIMMSLSVWVTWLAFVLLEASGLLTLVEIEK